MKVSKSVASSVDMLEDFEAVLMVVLTVDLSVWMALR